MIDGQIKVSTLLCVIALVTGVAALGGAWWFQDVEEARS